MPYTKPSATERPRASENESAHRHVPALSIVSFLTTSGPPVVDASKYQSRFPDLDTPPRKSKKPRQQQPQQQENAHDSARAAVRPQKWRIAPDVLKGIRRRINAGEQLKFIAASTGVPVTVLGGVAREMRLLASVPAPAQTPAPAPEKTTQREQVRRMLVNGDSVQRVAAALGMTGPAVSTAKYSLRRAGLLVQAEPAPTPVAAPTPVECPVVQVDRVTAVVPAPVPAPAPTPVVCLPAHPEKQRLYVLDWQRRMNAFEFSNPPAGCLPGKGRKHRSGLTRGQIREHLGGGNSISPCAINCVASKQGQPPSAPESTKNHLKTRDLRRKNARKKGFDFTWESLCTN